MKTTKETIEQAPISNHIMISFEEYTRLKDIETRFTILKNQMLHAEYCPLHTQVILGIENECAAKQKELNLDMLPLVGKKKG